VLGHFKDTSLNVGMRMLTLTVTIELRVDMPIFWTKAAQMIRLPMLSVLGALITLLPLSVFSLEISTPVGTQQIGQILDLKSTLSNVPQGVESQLRSTCLRARINTLESMPGGFEGAVSREVLVNFDPTIRRGGVIEFRSVSPVNDAVIEMELVSECPLIVFNTKWTLIMKQGVAERSGAVISGHVGTASAFDPETSSLLASSRKPPKPRFDTKPAWLSQDERNAAKPKPIEDETSTNILTTAENMEEGDNPVLKVASLNPDLFGAGLIESRRQTTDVSGGLGLDEYTSKTDSYNAMQEFMLPVSLAISALLMIALFLYRRYSVRKAAIQSSLNPQGYDSEQTTCPEPQDVAAMSREHVIAFSSEPASVSVGSHRVLESLIGNDEQDFDDELNSSAHTMTSGSMNPAYRSSLKISLELINRADIPSWNLPVSYLGLVESRNRSLELHRTLDALLLRSQIGLIELAFQDAKQDQLTPPQSSQELLEQVLGDQLHEIELKPTLCVPDVVKSHVRAKMCEIAGAQKRQLLRENLVNLHTQVVSPALCFDSNAWREFLSEEGILD
tara:strand:- start:1353 stop:3035 length:1683 start_codon:yes stop_codon:yes gene_type:complete